MDVKDEGTDLFQFFNVILKRKWLIIYITLLSTMTCTIISIFVIKPTFESKVTFVVVKEQAKIFYEDKYTDSDVMMFQRLIKTYAEIANSNAVIRKTANNLQYYSMKDIKNSVTIVPKADTQILELKVKRHGSSEAASIANEYAKNFIQVSNKILPAGQLNILDKGDISYEPILPKKGLNITIAFFLGLMVSIGIAFLLEYIDDKVRTEEQIKLQLDMPVLISIPEYHF